MRRTFEELERRAYISGDVPTAALLREIIDTADEVPACGHSASYDAGYTAAIRAVRAVRSVRQLDITP